MARKAKIRDEFYYVSLGRDLATGTVVHERWEIKLPSRVNVPGHMTTGFHRYDAPASLIRNPTTDVVTSEGWYQYGNAHREGGPAKINRDPKTGIAVKEQWFHAGLLHRTDGPAVIHRRSNGAVTYTQWFRDGILIPRHKRPRTHTQSETPRP